MDPAWRPRLEVSSWLWVVFGMNIAFPDDAPKLLDQSSHRISSVEDTLARMAPMAERFGITRVANITGLDRIGIPVALAVRPNARSVAVSQGKGSTYSHAKVSALMEAIEIWHAEHFSGPVYYGKQRELQKTWKIVDTSRLPSQPGVEFSERTPLLWVEGTDLFSGDIKLVPFEMIHADYTRPVAPAHGYFPASTNGLASGNSLLEAACHALAEVIERDATTLWHFADDPYKEARRIDPETVQATECRNLLSKVIGAGLGCGIWDVTSDLGIPTVMCLISDDKDGHVGLGAGCHPASEVALRRAITEAAQTRLNYVSGARDDLDPIEYSEGGRSEKKSYAAQELMAGASPRHFGSVPTITNLTHREDLEWMLKALSRVGITEAIRVDLTQADYGIPVARIVVPGLEAPHDDDQYVAGPRARKFAAASGGSAHVR